MNVKRQALVIFVLNLSLVLSSCGSEQLVEPTLSHSLTTTPSTQTINPQGEIIQVTSTVDSGPGSLRQALQDAQSGDIITFDPLIFPPDSPILILLESELPFVNQNYITIDASNAGVILDGSAMTIREGNCLTISSDWNIVQGLQVVNCPSAGIGLEGGAQHNIIGGDRNLGSGPLGQGNLINGNGEFGIGLWGEKTSFNTIQGNYIGINLDASGVWGGHLRDGIHSGGASQNIITENVIGGNEKGVYLGGVTEGRNVVTNNVIGTDPSGDIPLGNQIAGVVIDLSNHNTVGPGNLIAHNLGAGVLFWEETSGNTITQNSIHDNGEPLIILENLVIGLQTRIPPPIIIDFDLHAGRLSGVACPNCVVEVFSDSGDEGAIYEGETTASANGAFELQKGSSFSGPHLTVTSTDSNGSTSMFSLPTSGESQSSFLQEENGFPRELLGASISQNLEGSGNGDCYDNLWAYIRDQPTWLGEFAATTGLSWMRIAFGPAEWPGVEVTGRYTPMNFGDFEDQVVNHLNERGITIHYNLIYFDENLKTAPGFRRFRTEQEIQDYLDYVRMVVTYFKGRIQYYRVWNEPNVSAGQQGIEVEDYIRVVQRLIPVIHEANPDAKILIGDTADLRVPEVQAYLMTILESDLMPLVDGIVIHPMYGSSPDYDELREYYYDYPILIENIKNTATAHGFTGEYYAEEMNWSTTYYFSEDNHWTYSEIVAAKYYARGIVINRGLGFYAGIGGPSYETYPHVIRVIQNLNILLAGAEPIDSKDMQIDSDVANMRSYWFSLSNGDYLVSIWTDGIGVDSNPGTPVTLDLSNFSAEKVMGFDILSGFEQEIVTRNEDGNLVIQGLLVKDYPVILRITH